MPPSIILAGGGTGGHLMPGLAVARALRAGGTEAVAFVGTQRGLEAALVPAAGFELDTIAIGGLKALGWRRQAGTLARLPRAVWQSAGILRRRQARVVLGIGGYASGPVLAAAALLRIPIVLLEVNAHTGLANRWAAPWAQVAAVNFAQTAKDFRRAVVTGIPVRPEFFQAHPPAARDPRPLLLVTGGSQGAHGLNELVKAAAPQPGCRLLHQTGRTDWAACAAAYQGLGERARAVAFLEDMGGAMAAADLVVCRAGASTLGELAASARAAVLVPFPGAADQHQLRNAEAWARAGAGVVREQQGLTAALLQQTITELLAQPQRLAAMGQAAKALAHPQAAEEIASLVLGAARRPPGREKP